MNVNLCNKGNWKLNDLFCKRKMFYIIQFLFIAYSLNLLPHDILTFYVETTF